MKQQQFLLSDIGYKKIANIGEATIAKAILSTIEGVEIPDVVKDMMYQSGMRTAKSMNGKGTLSEDLSRDEMVIKVIDMSKKMFKKQFDLDLLRNGGSVGVAFVSYLVPIPEDADDKMKELTKQANAHLLEYTKKYIKDNTPELTTNEQTYYDCLSDEDKADYVIRDMYKTVYEYWIEEGLRIYNEKSV